MARRLPEEAIASPGGRDDGDAIDRHALVLTLWLPAGLVAAALVQFALGRGGVVALAFAFAFVLVAFAGHIIVNHVTRSTFTSRELALGLVLYLGALLAFVLSALASPALWQGRHWTGVGGFVLLFVAVVLYLVIARGVRGAFESFDVIRSFRGMDDGERHLS